MFPSFWFEKTLNLIRGMFSIFLFDRKENNIYAAIDRFGEKPFYFGTINNSFVFASELKALKKYDNFNNEININAVDDFMRYSCIRAPNTIYENIFKLEQGSMIKINIKDLSSMFINNTFLQNKKYYKHWFKSEDQLISNKKILILILKLPKMI